MDSRRLALGALTVSGLLVGVAYSAPQPSGGSPKPGSRDAGPITQKCPIDNPDCNSGCTTAPPACTMPDGCPGTRTACVNRHWVGCDYTGTGVTTCTHNGVTGTRACTTSGPSQTCVAQCTACGLQGSTRWFEGQSTDWTPRDCDIRRNLCTTAACGSTQGIYSCESTGLVCRFVGGNLPIQNCMTHGLAGTTWCSNGGDGLCRAPEDCNGYDDDLDGLVDNLPGQGAHSLYRGCNGSQNGGDSECVGRQTCPSGSWTDCSGYVGFKACTNRCGDAQAKTCDPVTGKLSACPQRIEQCNGLDDDCNGQIDENDVCVQSASCPAVP